MFVWPILKHHQSDTSQMSCIFRNNHPASCIHTIGTLSTLKQVWLDEIKYVPPWHEGYFLSFTLEFYHIMLSCLNLKPRHDTWTKTLNVLSQYLLPHQQVHAVPRTKFRVSFMMSQFYSPSVYFLILLFFFVFPFSSFFSSERFILSLSLFFFSPSLSSLSRHFLCFLTSMTFSFCLYSFFPYFSLYTRNTHILSFFFFQI